MGAARQNKIDTYAAELTNIAHVSIHQEDLLKGIIKCIELYKDRIITKQQLDKEYKNAMRQVKYEIKIKQIGMKNVNRIKRQRIMNKLIDCLAISIF